MTLDTQTAEEWNQLGFYYEYDNELKQWRFIGSKIGLSQLINIIVDYTDNKSNNGLSEHIHLGPYSYLKIMTWNEPIIADTYIGGSLKDLKRLSSLIDSKLELTEVGSVFKISDDYAAKNTATLIFFVMNTQFKPSSIEF